MKIDLKQLSRDDGYTFIEVFITLIIVSLLSSLLILNSSTIKNSIVKGSLNIEKEDDLLELKILLTSKCQLIQPPWFLKDYKYEKSDSSLEIFYLNGDMEKSLIFENSSSGIIIKEDENTIFSSKILIGEFTIDGNYLIYSEENRELVFLFGVLLV